MTCSSVDILGSSCSYCTVMCGLSWNENLICYKRCVRIIWHLCSTRPKQQTLNVVQLHVAHNWLIKRYKESTIAFEIVGHLDYNWTEDLLDISNVHVHLARANDLAIIIINNRSCATIVMLTRFTLQNLLIGGIVLQYDVRLGLALSNKQFWEKIKLPSLISLAQYQIVRYC